MESILTYKSKNTALVDPARGINAHVYFGLNFWHKNPNGYTAEFCYYYKKDVLDENDEVIGEKEVVISYLGLDKNIPNSVVNFIATSITSTAETYVERENQFLAAGALGIIGEDNHYGFGAGDYELFVEESEE